MNDFKKKETKIKNSPINSKRKHISQKIFWHHRNFQSNSNSQLQKLNHLEKKIYKKGGNFPF